MTILPVDAEDTREEIELIVIAEEAMKAIRQTFERWMEIARALDIGRTRAMAETGANDIQDRGYQKAFGRWLTRHPQFKEKEIPGSTRMWLFRCYDHQGHIIEWRRAQGITELIRYNFPETVFKRWAKAESPELLTELQQMRAKKRPSEARQQAAAASAIDEATQDLRGVVDDVMAASGGAVALTYDLGDEHYGESAGNFVAVYGATYGDKAILRFADALRALVSKPPRKSSREPKYHFGELAVGEILETATTQKGISSAASNWRAQYPSRAHYEFSARGLPAGHIKRTA